MPRKVHRDDTGPIAAARKRLDAACMNIANVLDTGERILDCFTESRATLTFTGFVKLAHRRAGSRANGSRRRT